MTPAERRLAAGALLAPLWALAAWQLSKTAVPDGLRLPAVDAEAVFGADLIEEAARYERFLYVVWALEQATLIAVLWLYARRGARFARESAAGPIGTGMLLGMLGLGLAWLAGIPFAIARLWWDRRHDVTEMGYAESLFGDYLLLGGTFAAVSFALLVVMFLARRLGESWWLPGAAAFTGVAAAFVLLSPYLTGATRPLDDPGLSAAAVRFKQAQGVEGQIPIDVEEVSGDTSEANAYATGLGPTRRVFLWDTLLDGRFSDGEEQAVLAHEIAHHSSDHLLEGIWWFGLLAAPGAYLIVLATRRRGGMGVPEAVPVALLVVVLYTLALSPLQNLISRRLEAEADWKALDSTRDPASVTGLMRGFAESSLSDPSPPRWTVVLFDSHPTLERRVAMAEAWSAYRGR